MFEVIDGNGNVTYIGRQESLFDAPTLSAINNRTRKTLWTRKVEDEVADSAMNPVVYGDPKQALVGGDVLYTLYRARDSDSDYCPVEKIVAHSTKDGSTLWHRDTVNDLRLWQRVSLDRVVDDGVVVKDGNSDLLVVLSKDSGARIR